MKPVFLLEDNLSGFDVDEEDPEIRLGRWIGDAYEGPTVGREEGLEAAFLGDDFVGGEEFLLVDAPELDMEIGGVEGDLFGVGGEVRGEGAVGIETEDFLKGVAGEDEDGAFVLGENVLAISAEAEVFDIEAERWGEFYCGVVD
jgi:hypothetical protein